jgi:hypothetical protein
MEAWLEQARREVIDLRKTWTGAGLRQKQELQRSLYPEGLAFSHEKSFFEPRNHSIREQLDHIYEHWTEVGVPDGI